MSMQKQQRENYVSFSRRSAALRLPLLLLLLLLILRLGPLRCCRPPSLLSIRPR